MRFKQIISLWCLCVLVVMSGCGVEHNELRQARRTFEVFANAEKVCEYLLTVEQRQRDAEQKLADLEADSVKIADQIAERIKVGELRAEEAEQRATTVDGQIGAIYKNVYTRPKVVLWFDDGNASDHDNCYPVLSALGLKATVAFYSDNLNAANYLTTAKCDTLYGAGWDFVNHTKSHPNLTTLTAQQVGDEFDACAAVLRANGWTRGNEFGVYPQGATNATVDAEARKRFLMCRGGRNTFANFQQASFGGIDYPMRLVTQATLDNATTSLAQANTGLANCVRLGSQYHVFCHSVVNGGSATTWELDTKFTPFAQNLARFRDSNLLDVVTITELQNGLTNPRKARA